MGLPYHLLTGARDWQPLLSAGSDRLSFDTERRQVTLAPLLQRFPARAVEEVYTPDQRRGSAVDCFGHIYWIDDTATEIRYSPRDDKGGGVLWTTVVEPPPGKSTGTFTPVPSPLARTLRLSGLTVTQRSFLVAGTLDPAGLLVIDLHAGTEPRWHPWPANHNFTPFDMTAALDGGLWILDRPPGAFARLWRLDCALRLVSPRGGSRTELAPAHTSVFHPVGGAARTNPAIDFPDGLVVGDTDYDPIAIVELPDGSVLLLDQGPAGDDARVQRVYECVVDDASVSLAQRLSELLPDEGFTGHDIAFLADANPVAGAAHTGWLFAAAATGNQSFAFRVSLFRDELDITATAQYLPMRRFAGKGLISGPRDVYYDQAGMWLPLTELARPRYHDTGSLTGLIFNGKDPGCVWHRLFFDGCIPPGDAVIVHARSADELLELGRAQWRAQRAPYLRRLNRHAIADARGDDVTVDESELPLHRPFASQSLDHAGVGTWELLFQEIEGRFLELRITLNGSGRSSPKIRSLRVYYPRLSYPRRFLPAVYIENPVSASFLERFLAIFEGVYSELEDRIASVEQLFDTRTVPDELVQWLGTWLGATFAEDWDDARRRLFISHAMQMYRNRGTARGLIQAARLATEACPSADIFDDQATGTPFDMRVVEHFAKRVLPTGELITAGGVLPRQVLAGDAWTPAQGGSYLNRLWIQFLCEATGLMQATDADSVLLQSLSTRWGVQYASIAQVLFPPLTVESVAQEADRQAFITRHLGAPYTEVTLADASAFADYLRRRWRTVDALNKAYLRIDSTAYESFAHVPMPEVRVPSDGAPLEDWYKFVTVDLNASRTAHRFSVLVPVLPEHPPAQRQQMLDQVAAVIERERPAHTQFDVQLYWALFRVGSARTGIDTILGEGSRFSSLVLDAGYIGQGLVDEAHPWHVADRWVSNRDRAGSGVI